MAGGFTCQCPQCLGLETCVGPYSHIKTCPTPHSVASDAAVVQVSILDVGSMETLMAIGTSNNRTFVMFFLV